MSAPDRVTFDTFGDRAKASSRLRAWMVMDELQRRGIEVEANGHIGPSDVHVFQKRWTAERAREAHERGALIVYDFDDNYLMEDHGTRRDTLMRMNAADLVSVGSPAMLEQVSRLHDRPFLLENPLDVPEDAPIKRAYDRGDGLVWFGAPENRDALEDLALEHRVTTITSDGDIKWELETIDRNLVSFDLALIPVELDEWTATKNANRLLKCIALGVPPLAARTPEHERVAELIDLPDWLLVERGADWDHAIERVWQHLAELDEVMRASRSAARRVWGIGAVVDRWLANIQMLPRAQPAPYPMGDPVREQVRELDVVILRTNLGQPVDVTVDSLKLRDLEYRRVSLLSTAALDVVFDADGMPAAHGIPPDLPDQVDLVVADADHFDLYEKLAELVNADGPTMVLRAGARITRGWFDLVRALDPEAEPVLMRTQFDFPRLQLAGVLPQRLHELILEPIGWDCVLLPALRDRGRMHPQLLDLMLWDLVIQMTRGDAGWKVLDLPAVVDDPRVQAVDPALDYAEWLRIARPEIAHDYPPREGESWRLRETLHGRLVERHRELFADYVSTLVPSLALKARKSSGESRGTTRDVSLARTWLERLAACTYDERPQLLRHEDGNVDLVDGGLRRPVGSGLVAAALEQAFGRTVGIREHPLAGDLPEGPPAVVFTDASGRLYFVAGGWRYPVVGLPVPVPAEGDDLGLFPRTDIEELNLATANVPAMKVSSSRVEAGVGWLSALPQEPGQPPRLIRTPDGSVYLIDNGLGRPVTSSYVAGGLEQIYGPIRDSEALPEDWDPGPPAAILQDRSGKLHFVANGVRRPVYGLPIPYRVEQTDLERFQPTDERLDLARGSVPVSRVSSTDPTSRFSDAIGSIRRWFAGFVREEDR